jgi:AcrR family transcriptional regulator
MRLRLLDAAVDCLYELGYSGTTTIEVAARAGVSRGAQLHHFPTKEKLVTEAVRHVLAKRLEEFRQAFAELPEGTDKPGAAIDILWEKLSCKVFYAWLELVVAARTDPQLKPRVTALTSRFTENVSRTFNELFPRPEGAPPYWDIMPVMTFAFLQGLALDAMVMPAREEIARALEIWRQLSELTMAGAGGNGHAT